MFKGAKPGGLLALFCLAASLLAACGDSGPYAAFQGVWEADYGGFLTRSDYDFTRNRIAYVTIKKGVPDFYFTGYILTFSSELAGDALRLTYKVNTGAGPLGEPMLDELKPDGDGKLTKNLSFPDAKLNYTYQLTRPDKTNNSLFARPAPYYDKLGGEWVEEDGEKPALLIDTAAGQATLLGLRRADPEQDAIRLARYDEVHDPEAGLHSAILSFDSPENRPIHLEILNLEQSRPEVRLVIGPYRSGPLVKK